MGKAKRTFSLVASIFIMILSFRQILSAQQYSIYTYSNSYGYESGSGSKENFDDEIDLTELNPDSNIMIRMICPRKDRMGSNVQRPLTLLSYANCKNYSFCIAPGAEGLAKYFSFPSCNPILNQGQNNKFLFSSGEINENETAIYDFSRACGGQNIADNQMHAALGAMQLSPDCTYSPKLRQRWSKMIHKAAFHPDINNTLAKQNFFWQSGESETERRQRRAIVHARAHAANITNADNTNTIARKSKTNTNTDNNDNDTIFIAVHIRRGDLVNWGQRCIWDEIYVQLLVKLRGALEQLGKKPVVHLFSEDYGMIDGTHNIHPNWTLYDGLVEEFHLAPEMPGNGDPALHIRDWRHFVMADILVIGGSFSRIPGYARPLWKEGDNDGITGLTIHYGISHLPGYKGQWRDYGNGVYKMDRIQYYNMPSILNITNE